MTAPKYKKAFEAAALKANELAKENEELRQENKAMKDQVNEYYHSERELRKEVKDLRESNKYNEMIRQATAKELDYVNGQFTGYKQALQNAGITKTEKTITGIGAAGSVGDTRHSELSNECIPSNIRRYF